eukprot:TRINITY_DN3974_c0_g1_i1.p1 TRINITY_DN3974_c0_g1~~TRINITY_DN3974_c0_g1_i1.p1  ORF type:complete len:1294 (+),score=304.30 TRINITY_DN3974_c0_g1_i1:451-4332(+)
MKGIAWSQEMNNDLSVVAGRCHEAERLHGVAPEDRKWMQPEWIPTTAASDLADPSMEASLVHPGFANHSIARNLKILVSLTKEVGMMEDNLSPMYSKLKAFESIIEGEGQGAIVAMQPLQCVIVSQASSTPLKAWEEFRTRYMLESTELQKCDKKDSLAGTNGMAVYIKFGGAYTPNGDGEREFSELEKVYVGVRRMGKEFYFGTDPRAGLTKEQNAESTEFACKVRSMSLRIEATYKTSLPAQIHLMCESRIPRDATQLLAASDGVYTMEIYRLKNLLSPDQTGVRHRADVEYQKKQLSRSKAAKKMSLHKAMEADHYGVVAGNQQSTLLANWLQVSPEVHIECAIRIQSIFRMFVVRKAYNNILRQVGVPTRTGSEMRLSVRKWLLACSQHFTWSPQSSTVVCYINSGVPIYAEYGGPSHNDLMTWCSTLTRLRTTIVPAVARAMGIPEARVKLEGVNGVVAGPRLIVKLCLVSTWSGKGSVVPQEVRTELFEEVRRLVMVLQTQLKQEFDINKVVLPQPKHIHGLEHVDVRTVTPQQAIRAVLTSKSNGAAGMPTSIRTVLEDGYQGGSEAAQQSILAVLLADGSIDGRRRRILEAPMVPGNAICKVPESRALASALSISWQHKVKCREFVINKTSHDVFTVAKLRGEKALVYEVPGVRQLEKTPLIMHSRYWADEGYYDDLPDFAEVQEKERVKLMLPTVRERREMKMIYNVRLFSDLGFLAAEEMGKLWVRISWFISLIFLCLTSYAIFLLPKWISNLTALVYNSDSSQLSLEQLMTWVMVYVLILMLCLALYGVTITIARNKFSFRLRTMLVYIFAKHSQLISADMVHTLREGDLRKTVNMIFDTIPRFFICTFVLFGCLITLFATSVQLGIICLFYLLVKVAMNTAYDRFMIRHMTAISNIEKEEQLRWVILKGPQGAAGHVVAQAADDHQMRLCMFAREKKEVNTSNMIVHTIAAVTDWVLMFSVPPFFLYVGAYEVAEPGEDGKQMAQQIEQLPYCFYYYVFLLIAWRMLLKATVSIVENRPSVLRLLTILRHVLITLEEREEMKRLLALDSDDSQLAAQMHVRRDDRQRESEGETPDVEMESVSDRERPPPPTSLGRASNVTLERKGWYKKRLLLKFDWFEALMDQHPLSFILMYFCLFFWLIFALCVVIFISTAWETECLSINATCKVLNTDTTAGDVTMPQVGDMFGRCTLLHPIAYSLRICSQKLKEKFPEPSGTFKAAVEYDTWQNGRIGFYKRFDWNATHGSPCPVEDTAWVNYRIIGRLEIESDEPLTTTFHDTCWN